MAPKVEIIHDERLLLGEGPHWDNEAQVLYYVDIDKSTVFKYVPSSEKITRVFVDPKHEIQVGFVIPVAGVKDKFVIGYGKKLAILTWDGESTEPSNIEILVDVDPGTENRFNDGKADPQGRLWSGTMFAEFTRTAPHKRCGTFYSLNADARTATAHLADIGISNGLAWSSDQKTFYYIDSCNRAVDAFDYDINSGTLANRRSAFEFKKNNLEGFPDGMTIDREDKLWFAVFEGGAVHRVDPETGALLQSIKLPALLITSVAWGGPNLDELYVTSSSIAEPEEDRYAGRLFKITGLGASGLPSVPVKL